MTRKPAPWRDPTFFGFVLSGVLLLATGAWCRLQADRAPVEVARQAVAAPPLATVSSDGSVAGLPASFKF
ncbi:MAG: hypothetical protein IT204_04970 [Fimbriimonadaceae bacterium]|nr:hypothetical protein [Fimbriimonadaceae bacterium]